MNKQLFISCLYGTIEEVKKDQATTRDGDLWKVGFNDGRIHAYELVIELMTKH